MSDATSLLAARLSDAGLSPTRDHPLGPLSTYRVGGSAAVFVEVVDESALQRVATAVVGSDVEVLVVGRGSNLLVGQGGFDGLAVQLGEGFGRVELDLDAAVVTAGGAASLPMVARRTAAAGLSGFEWAVGVPGSIGGAVRMNAGGHGSDMAASLRSVRVLDLATGEAGDVPADSLDLSYRHSSVLPSQVVVEATLGLRHGDVAASESKISQIVRWRREHQPGGANAGSVFTNPEGDSAGRLIDLAGCKGLRIGSAVVSEKHANFIQVDPGGSADDVLALMAEVQRRVMDHCGVELAVETRLVGARSAR